MTLSEAIAWLKDMAGETRLPEEREALDYAIAVLEALT